MTRGLIFLLSLLLVRSTLWTAPADPGLPQFGRDTVLVWKTSNQEENSSFVVRIAEFEPGRFIEWENSITQGTVYMTPDAVAKARVFINSRLFDAGMDTKSKDSLILWLSRQVYQELKAKGKAKLSIDSVQGLMVFEGTDEIVVEINKSPVKVPVIKVKDDRGQERWFLDREDNPLMVKHVFRAYTQTLASINTDRPNTLRWIKGKKLSAPR
jgi:hypothetical protein